MKKAYTILAITSVIFMTGYYAKGTGDENRLKTYEEVMLGSYRKPVGMVGGLTQFQALEQSHKDIWTSVLNKYTSNVELIKLGAPVEVSTQVVAGVNYVFKFRDGTVITVWAKLDNTVEISEVKTKKQANANNEKIITSLIEEYKKRDTNRLLKLELDIDN